MSSPRSGAGFDVAVVTDQPGSIDLTVEGPDERITPFFRESGGHRWQRVPPTERRGRVHSSTVTVVVMAVPDIGTTAIPEHEIETSTMRGSGPGGQHRNVTESAVRMRHIPSGVDVKICVDRSQLMNRRIARQLLEARVAALRGAAVSAERSATRRDLAGSGERADKVRTYRVKDDVLTDHRTGTRSSVTQFLSGRLPR